VRVIITGGAGFIGSNVAAAFLRDGDHVTIFDSLQRPGSERNVAWLTGRSHAQERLRIIKGDVRDADLVHEVVGAEEVQRVFHFAAQTAVTTSLVHPREDLEVNLLGTHNVLEAARTSRASVPPAVFFTSTNKVYGALGQHETVETPTRFRFTDPQLDAEGVDEAESLDFHSPYGCSKGAADQYVRDYARIYGLRTVVFRMSCVYGPRQFGTEDQGWLAHFMIVAASGQSLTINGNGKQVRDLLFIDDLVNAFELAARHLDRTAGNVYNIGGGPANSVSIWEELAPRLEQLAGRRIETVREAWRPGDQTIYVSNTRRAFRDFGWQPQVNVAQGLTRLWTWALALQREHGLTIAVAGSSR
jgi:CDP-paratose 2-epimerase